MQESMRDTCQIMSDSMSKYVPDKMADTMSEKKYIYIIIIYVCLSHRMLGNASGYMPRWGSHEVK